MREASTGAQGAQPCYFVSVFPPDVSWVFYTDFPALFNWLSGFPIKGHRSRVMYVCPSDFTLSLRTFWVWVPVVSAGTGVLAPQKTPPGRVRLG